MPAEFSCAGASITFLFAIGLLYLYQKNRGNKSFLYTSVPFLCAAVSLFGHYLLKLAASPNQAVFWTKFKYVGIFGYAFAFPLFVSSITKIKLKRTVVIMLGSLTLLYMILTVFTNLVISNQVRYYSTLLRADRGILYPYFLVLFFAIAIYYFSKIFKTTDSILSKKVNYKPVVIGIGFAIVTSVIDVVGVTIGRPLIHGIIHPHITATIVFSLGYAWTFLSQYSWVFGALTVSEKQIAQLIARSDKSFVEFVQLIAKTLDAKDHYTAGHSLRVMGYATKIARKLDLSGSEIELLRHACLLHDIGKIGIPDGILNKETPLTEEERKHITKHPVLGKQILSTVTEFQDILEIIYSHHERFDGNGYPDGLRKDEIPLLARVIAVADAYDAMRSERPYRKAMTKAEAVEELKKVKDHQLDGRIVETFIKVITA